MKTTALLACVTAIIALASGAPLAPESKNADKAAGTDTKETPPPPSVEKSKLGLDELEAKFKATLTKATLSGRWCAIQDGQLGP